ncbi:peroxidase-related enzyme [Nitrosopumilus sp.]|nr:peroxidase-related enzyme [Nitrosopumilus sp.]
MPFVKEGDESNVELSTLYKEINKELQIGKIPNILKTTSIDPQIAKWFWDGVKIILLRESSIPRLLKESIAVVVSNANSCNYCTQAHGMLLQLMGFTDKKIVDLKNNFESFSDKETAALNYALKINDSANKTTLDDHIILKEFGYDDKQIVEITSVVASFNWANIIADALGTDMES